MNKTITINLGGIVFHIDENAYEILKNYIASLKKHFAVVEGKEEIISDIESRIAEMFQTKLRDDKQVITETDVEEVIAIMGKPENLEDVVDEAKTESFSIPENVSTKKRLFRNPDDKILGGVCAGISSYLDVDPIWLRLAFTIAFFGFGTGLLIYIVLWIIIPPARTTAEKLQMKGEKVNVENIQKSIREELDGVKNKFSNLRDEAKQFGQKNQGTVQGFLAKIVEVLTIIITAVFSIFIKFMAVIGVLIALAVLIVLFACVSGLGNFSGSNFPLIVSGFFDSRLQQTIGFISLALIVGVPFFALLYKSSKVLFNVKVKSRKANIVLLSLWFLGLIMGVFTLGNSLSYFHERASYRQTLKLNSPVNSTLYIEAIDSNEYHTANFNINSVPFKVYSDSNKIILDNVSLDIQKSNTPDIELLRVQSATGRNKKEAYNTAAMINYAFSQTDSVLFLNSGFTLKDKFRDQRVKLILKLPVGKSVMLSNSLEDIVFDIKNVTDTYDRDMLGKKWTMTEAGLKCIDCADSETYRYPRHERHHHKDQDDEDEDTY